MCLPVSEELLNLRWLQNFVTLPDKILLECLQLKNYILRCYLYALIYLVQQLFLSFAELCTLLYQAIVKRQRGTTRTDINNFFMLIFIAEFNKQKKI